MIKYLARLKSKKAFTLTELIVVVALIGIIMASIAAFSSPLHSVMRSANARSQANTISKIISDYIERRIAYANFVSIYSGISYKSGETDAMYASAKADYDRLIDLAKETSDGKRTNTPGVLYFHFDDSSNLSNKDHHTFRVYDMPIVYSSSLTSPATITEFVEKVTKCAEKTTDAAGLEIGKAETALYRVFNEEFYGNYEFLITMGQLGVRENTLKQRANLSFGISAFNFDGDVKDASGEAIAFTEDYIKKYYKYLDREITTDPLTDYYADRTGVENVSFALENISSASSVNLTQGMGTSPSKVYGTDMIVFYNVRTYDLINDK